MANSTGTTTQITDFNNINILPDLTNNSASQIAIAMWGLDKNTTKDVVNLGRMYSSTHGMFAAVPILCKDADCAYKDVCMIEPANRQYGGRCPMEISAIMSRYTMWCSHFNIDISNDYIDPKDLVDATLVRDLVNIEIQMLRAENKIALTGDFMADTLLEVDKKCNAYYGKIVSPESEFLMSLQDKKIKLLNQLNATRKDKAADKRRENISDDAMKIFQEIRNMEKNSKNSQDITDIEFDEDGNIIVEEENNTKSDENEPENTEI